MHREGQPPQSGHWGWPWREQSSARRRAARPRLLSADAVDCSWAHSNKDAGAGGTTTSTRMQAGPYGACGTVVVAGPGVKMYYHCYVVNKYGNKWSHVRAAGTSINGWVWNEHLDDGGSTKRC
ncbi:hypothetical protein IHE61_26035 [Streptomyces sp. GKU 257-1]|nr:hypothetical protein [Streptomyces sp. GKU 257-1]